MTRDEAIKLVRDKKCPTSRREAAEWVELFEQLGMLKLDDSYCHYCDMEFELHEDAQGFHHVVKGERAACTSAQGKQP